MNSFGSCPFPTAGGLHFEVVPTHILALDGLEKGFGCLDSCVDVVTWPETVKIGLQQAVKDATATVGASIASLGIQAVLRFALASGSGAIALGTVVTVFNIACAAYYGQRLGSSTTGRVIFGGLGGLGAGMATAVPLYLTKDTLEMAGKAIGLSGSSVYSVCKDLYQGSMNGCVPSIKGAPEVVEFDKESNKLKFSGKALQCLLADMAWFGVFQASFGAPLSDRVTSNLSSMNISVDEFLKKGVISTGGRSGVEFLYSTLKHVDKKLFFADQIKRDDPKCDGMEKMVKNASARNFLNSFVAMTAGETNGPWPVIAPAIAAKSRKAIQSLADAIDTSRGNRRDTVLDVRPV